MTRRVLFSCDVEIKEAWALKLFHAGQNKHPFIQYNHFLPSKEKTEINSSSANLITASDLSFQLEFKKSTENGSSVLLMMDRLIKKKHKCLKRSWSHLGCPKCVFMVNRSLLYFN